MRRKLDDHDIIMKEIWWDRFRLGWLITLRYRWLRSIALLIEENDKIITCTSAVITAIATSLHLLLK